MLDFTAGPRSDGAGSLPFPQIRERLLVPRPRPGSSRDRNGRAQRSRTRVAVGGRVRERARGCIALLAHAVRTTGSRRGKNLGPVATSRDQSVRAEGGPAWERRETRDPGRAYRLTRVRLVPAGWALSTLVDGPFGPRLSPYGSPGGRTCSRRVSRPLFPQSTRTGQRPTCVADPTIHVHVIFDPVFRPSPWASEMVVS
jgi:hypothetical protein